MKLHCHHCDAQLTTDIYPTNDWHVDRGKTEDEPWYEYSITPGTFIVGINPYNDRDTPIIMVNPDNVTIPIPEYEEGMGCCNISHTPIHCPCCGAEVATGNIDCWQDKSIDFDLTQCDKVYMKAHIMWDIVDLNGDPVAFIQLRCPDGDFTLHEYQKQLLQQIADACGWQGSTRKASMA